MESSDDVADASKRVALSVVDMTPSTADHVPPSTNPIDVSSKNLSLFEDSFDYPDDEATRAKMLTAALQQEDEFLEYLMSLPALAATPCSAETPLPRPPPPPPPLVRSTSEKSGGSSGGGAKVGLDHLDNLCKLMEQLGDLRERNSKLQRRVQYLEDLKHLQEMHKQLQQETRHSHRHHETDPLPSQHHPRHRESSFPNDSPRRAKKQHCRHRQSLQPSPQQQRDRSQSVGIDDINEYQEDYSRAATKQAKRQRRSIAGFASGNKAKVSKWTKVKEAFRWEKASVATLPETKSQDSGIGGITTMTTASHHRGGNDGGRYLRVPVGEALSGSPSADSVISSHSMCSSGGPSTGEYALPPTTVISSTSSSSEDMEFDLNYSDILMEFGPQRSASATDSVGGTICAPLTRRLSLTKTPEEDASRRSKSLDGDENNVNMLLARQFANKDDAGKICPNKSHKTPWGKVKDIIQTRKDSLKQRQHRQPQQGDRSKTRQRRGSHKTDAREGPTSSDLEEEAPVFDPAVEAPSPRGGSGGTSPTVEDSTEGVKSPACVRPRIEVTSDANRRHKTSTTSLGNYGDPLALTNRRLTPMLTITLPSTEELRQLSCAIPKCNSKPPPSPQTEERTLKVGTVAAAQSPGEELATRRHENKQQMSVLGPPGGVDGTSPPANRRSSKWTKVKKAFLTSAAPGQRGPEEASGQLSGSMPSSPNRMSSFFYETDPDEFSSNELAEVACDDEDPPRDPSSEPATLQAEIQRNYEELQQKLSQEFHKKLHEWERIKSVTSAAAPSVGRASTSAAGGGEENYLHDKGFRRKMEEWERMKHKDGTNNGKRDSVAIHQLDEDNLSPHFLKKLHEWQRIKKVPPREELPQSRKKLGEWHQLWRTGSGKQGGEESDDFHRKLQEWERMKSTSPCESPTSKDGGAGGADSDRNSSGGKTPSPGVVRKNSTSGNNAKKKAVAGGSGSGSGKPAPKAKTQKEKELQWLEKELQKIEREKQRLEREREKYLDKESRLEKMRRAVGSSPSKQEVLIQTSTGFFRFQGISEKFTRRLYEWEKARGIAPEASTFALLDPGYRPTGERQGGMTDSLENGGLTRSKSASSVTNLTSGIGSGATMSHQPSSLSLNDVEGLEAASRGGGHTVSENDDDDGEDDEPAAVIVDVEDVVEETAALLEETPAVQGQTPVYCYAPEEVTRLIDSSGSESERDGTSMVRRTDSVRTESSYQLIEENIHLLSKLQIKGDICRKLETDLDDLEEKIDQVKRTHEKELDRLRQEEKEIQELTEARAAMQLDHSSVTDGDQASLVDALRARIRELERRQERLKREGATLQDSFAEHSEQQAALAQNLVGKMKLLQQVNSNMASFDQQDSQGSVPGCLTGRQEDAVAMVQELSTQLLGLAEKLEVALGERNREIHNLRFELEDRRRGGGGGGGGGGGCVRMSRGLSADSSMSVSLGSLITPETNSKSYEYDTQYLPRQSSVELTKLPSLLTNKVLELKQGLNYLCSTTESHPDLTGREETAAFNVRVSPKNHRQASQQAFEEPSVTTHTEGNTTPPVTSVTITPGFLRRQTRVKEVSQERENLVEFEWKAKSSERASQEDARVSVCSARSSSTSSANEYAEDRTVDRRKLVTDLSGSLDETRKADNEFRSVSLEGKHSSKENLMVDSQLKPCGTLDLMDNSKKVKPLNDDETLLPKTVKRKVFKLRRSPDSNGALKVKNRVKEENVSVVIKTPCSSDSISAEERIGQNSLVSLIPKRIVNGKENASKDLATVEISSNSNPLATPPSVFVPTTRKIFSPVRRDSKGKASSVIGYVVEEETETEPNTDTPTAAVIETNIPRPVGMTTPPPWMITKSRSQSASPALPRRKLLEDNTVDESGNIRRGLQLSPDGACENVQKVTKLRRSSGSFKETKDRLKAYVVPEDSVAEQSEQGSAVINEEHKENQVNADKKETLIHIYPSTCTPLGFPPLPPSPSPGRRDLFKQIAKDTAPSIRMMIAKYNQKLTEQDGGRSPEIGGSGSGSPVAWRSPVAERRVRAQMAKYQEEVQRVLQQGGRRIVKGGYGEVQKSASAGVIRAPEAPSAQSKSSGEGTEGKPAIQTIAERRGILKSSSAGSIKQTTTEPLSKPATNIPVVVPNNKPPVEEDKLVSKTILKETSERLLVRPTLEPVQPASPCLARAAELPSDVVGSPPLNQLRALRLQRAKEEFLSRGPGGRSWTSDADSSLIGSSNPSVSSGQVWVKSYASCSGDTSKNRLSQISVGSESSYGSQILALTPEEVEEDDGSLMKSASAGMINVDSKTYKKFSVESNTDSLPRTSKEKTNSHNKFGISSLTSKFRKVKMRKTKDKDGSGGGGGGGGKSKLNTVSLLCRQSLLVDINNKKEGGGGDGGGPSTSKSCPSSPVLQRTASTENTTDGLGDGQGAASWIRNPAKKIFKPK